MKKYYLTDGENDFAIIVCEECLNTAIKEGWNKTIAIAPEKEQCGYSNCRRI